MEEKKKGFFARLKEGLTKTRNSIVSGIDSVFRGFTDIDDDFYEEIEEILIMGDLGVDATEKILTDMKQKVKELHLKEPHECKEVLIDSIRRQMDLGENAYEFEHRKSVVLVIGVNGVGKTTSIGKLADQLKAEGNSVLLAAADTFRAGAIDQIDTWATRLGVHCVKGKMNQDPSSVLVDACRYAKENDVDILICDTAGRLQNKTNLMNELSKMHRVVQREIEGAPQEVWLVLDATTGQNGISQAKVFLEATDVTGIVLTKMDGTAKGGVVLAIRDLLHLPVRFLGLGEKPADLRPFDINAFLMGITKGMEE